MGRDGPGPPWPGESRGSLERSVHDRDESTNGRASDSYESNWNLHNRRELDESALSTLEVKRVMKELTIVLALAFASNALAQSPEKTSPVVVKRSAAPKVKPADTALQNKIESDLKALRQDPAATPGTTASPLVPVGPIDRAPAGYNPAPDLPLSPTAEHAVPVSGKRLTETVPPAPGPHGRGLYSYSIGLGTVGFAPLRACL